ncbi:MAG: DUF2294 domain-containing protein [Anaerolineales bacterium]|nr:DUF2294 domain-containing protein [Anaerolineales bacterium]
MTKGELEAEFTKQIVRFEKEYLGRGPIDARSYLINDMVIVRLRGVMTPVEEKLAENKEGQALVKEARRQLFETSRPILAGFVKDVLDTELIDLFSDISTETGERIIVFTVKKNFGKN